LLPAPRLAARPTAPCPPTPPVPPQITLRHFFEFAAFLCEEFVFAYLGLQVLGWGGLGI
jgi:hypothetical protein